MRNRRGPQLSEGVAQAALSRNAGGRRPRAQAEALPDHPQAVGGPPGRKRRGRPADLPDRVQHDPVAGVADQLASVSVPPSISMSAGRTIRRRGDDRAVPTTVTTPPRRPVPPIAPKATPRRSSHQQQHRRERPGIDIPRVWAGGKARDRHASEIVGQRIVHSAPVQMRAKTQRAIALNPNAPMTLSPRQVPSV